MNEWPCPHCDVMVPSTGASSRQPGQHSRQHAMCPNCERPLVRTIGADDEGWKPDDGKH